MTEVELSAPPELGTAELNARLRTWLNERYGPALTEARQRIGRRVQFRHPQASSFSRRGNTGATAEHAGKTGKITRVYIKLNDTSLYRVNLQLDNSGGEVPDVDPKDVYDSSLTDADFANPVRSVPLRSPIARIKLAEKYTPDEALAGRKVRFIERAPIEGLNLFGRSGVIDTVFVSSGPTGFMVRVDGLDRRVKVSCDQVRYL